MDELEVVPDVEPGELAFFDDDDLMERFLVAGTEVQAMVFDFFEDLDSRPCDGCLFEFSMELTKLVCESFGLVGFKMDPALIATVQSDFTRNLAEVREAS